MRARVRARSCSPPPWFSTGEPAPMGGGLGRGPCVPAERPPLSPPRTNHGGEEEGARPRAGALCSLPRGFGRGTHSGEGWGGGLVCQPNAPPSVPPVQTTGGKEEGARPRAGAFCSLPRDFRTGEGWGGGLLDPLLRPRNDLFLHVPPELRKSRRCTPPRARSGRDRPPDRPARRASVSASTTLTCSSCPPSRIKVVVRSAMRCTPSPERTLPGLNLTLQVLPAGQCLTLSSRATDCSRAVGPCVSAPWQAPTPSTSGAPLCRPSGVAPVQCPALTWPFTGHTPQV